MEPGRRQVEGKGGVAGAVGGEVEGGEAVEGSGWALGDGRVVVEDGGGGGCKGRRGGGCSGDGGMGVEDAAPALGGTLLVETGKG